MTPKEFFNVTFPDDPKENINVCMTKKMFFETLSKFATLEVNASKEKMIDRLDTLQVNAEKYSEKADNDDESDYALAQAKAYAAAKRQLKLD